MPPPRAGLACLGVDALRSQKRPKRGKPSGGAAAFGGKGGTRFRIAGPELPDGRPLPESPLGVGLRNFACLHLDHLCERISTIKGFLRWRSAFFRAGPLAAAAMLC